MDNMLRNKVFLPPSRGDIIKLSQSDPTLHAALSYWNQGQMPFEDALMLAVCALMQEKQSLTAELDEIISNMPVRYTIK